LIWGNPDRLSYAVEIEHSPTQDTLDDKLDKYVKQTAVDDMIPINANELPLDVNEMREHIEEKLGL